MPGEPIAITDPNPLVVETRPGADVTPTVGLSGMTGQDTGKVVGSSGADRATLFDLEKDTDQVIKTGDGDDVFVFGNNTTDKDLNGIVKMGAGEDSVYMTHLVSDYVFKLREDGGIKITYIGEPDGLGDSVTFYDAETFIFRNISADGTNYVNSVFTHDELFALISGSASE